MVLLLLLSVNTVSFANIDSLQKVANTTKNDSIYVYTNLRIAKQYALSRRDTCLFFLERSLKRAKDIKNNRAITKIHVAYAEYFDLVERKPGKASEHILEGRQFLAKMNDERALRRHDGILNFYQGKNRLNKGEFPEAQKHFLTAKKIYRETDDIRGLLNTYNQLVILHGQQEQLETAENILNEAIEVARTNESYYMLMTFLSNKGGLLHYTEKFEESSQAYLEAEELIFAELDSNDFYSLGLIHANIAKNYNALNDTSSTILHNQKALNYRKRTNDKLSMASISGALCSDCAHLKKYDLALSYCEEMQAILDSVESLDLKTRMTIHWIDYYKAIGNYEAAFNKQVERSKLREQLINEKNIKLQTEQEKDFEFKKERLAAEKKQLESKQKLALKNEKIAATEKQKRNLFIGIFTLIILAFGLLFLLRKNRKNQKVIAHKNELLEASVNEKEMLLKEIHHRVKNNLQLVSSLLHLQSKKTDNEIVHVAFEEGKSRIQSMSLIHQKLYENDDLGKIDFNNYINELIGYFSTLHKHHDRVKTNINVENIELDIDTAIPLGLIVNELITNAFKYAYGKTENPELNIKITHEGKGDYTLSVSDNGPGLPDEFDWKKTKTLGLRLVKNLSKQLLGSINYTNKTFVITFKDRDARLLFD